MSGRDVIFVELNEINWRVVDALVEERGPEFLPNFQRLRREGACATPVALETPPDLDPWVTWVTVHTGVPQAVHGARILEQDSSSVHAKRLWEYAADAGRSVGVFGSIGAYPPRPVKGFMVPGPFAPSDATFPESLRPIQALNRMHTRAHGDGQPPMSVAALAATGLRLLGMGLGIRTCALALAQLARERVDGSTYWRRVALQPLLNFDFFSHLYRRERPAFSTWHSNHAAHYMHHYWRAWNGAGFLTPGPEEEKRKYGEAVPLGYQVCDQLLGRFIGLAAGRAVLVVCSSMGQQPFVNAAYRDGKVIVRFRDVRAFLDRLGATGVTEIVPTMVPQVNIRVTDAGQRSALVQRLADVSRVSPNGREKALSVQQTGEILTVTPFGLNCSPKDVRYHLGGECSDIPYELAEFFAADAPTVKQGMHHESGLFIAYGPGVPRGAQLPDCTNLDIAPTVLSLLGVEVPSVMNGRPML